MIVDFSTFLNRFERLKNHQGWTDQQAAESLGYTRSWWMKLKKERRTPKSKVWRALDDAERKVGIFPRDEPNPILSDIPYIDHPSKETSEAHRREMDDKYPTKHRLKMLRALSELARLRHPNNEALQESDLDALLKLLIRVEAEAVKSAASQFIGEHLDDSEEEKNLQRDHATTQYDNIEKGA